MVWEELINMFTRFSNAADIKSIEGIVSVMRSFLCNCSSLNFVSEFF